MRNGKRMVDLMDLSMKKIDLDKELNEINKRSDKYTKEYKEWNESLKKFIDNDFEKLMHKWKINKVEYSHEVIIHGFIKKINDDKYKKGGSIKAP
jgi:hypothetical protein